VEKDMTISPSTQADLAGVVVDPAIFERWPNYRVLAIVAQGLAIPGEAVQPEGSSPLDRAEAAVRARGITDWTTEPHLAAWMRAYADFGAKPKRTSPSALALIKRVDAGLPRIDPLTDLYNAVSVTHALPIGGEDLDAYVGPPRLTIATGDEPFDTIDKGEPVTDHPGAGEVVWRDDLGITCRRWNWRQCVRTRITPESRNVIFLLEALEPMTDSELLAAGDELMVGLRDLSPGVRLATRLIAAP
jgi:DNA/RNA-binding domain of Phe-tRNA-synthetase-like protein